MMVSLYYLPDTYAVVWKESPTELANMAIKRVIFFLTPHQ